MSGHRRVMPNEAETGFSEKPAWGPALFIGRIETMVGGCSLIRSDGAAIEIKPGDPVFEGDIVETAADGRITVRFIDGTVFNLSDNARMVLKEFAGEDASTSTLLDVTQGTFAFIGGEMAKAGRLGIDTPFARIRGRASAGGIGMLSLMSLFFSAIDDVQAASSDVSFLDDGHISFKDLGMNGTVELITRENPPRHIMLDDPGETIVLRRVGSSISEDHITNSLAQMVQLQSAQQDVLHTFTLGLQSGPTNAGGLGSGTTPLPEIPPFVPIGFTPPPAPGAPGLPGPGGGIVVPPAPIIFVPPPPPPPPPVDQPPVLTLDHNGLPDTFHLNNPGLAITGTGTLITDPDNAFLQSATITLTDHQPNDVLSVSGILPSGIIASAYNAATGVLTLTGPGTLAAYEAALHQIVFSTTDLSQLDRLISVFVNDGSLNSNTATTTFHVSTVNLPPVAHDDHIITDAGPGTSIQIPFSTLLANDTDPDTPHDQLSVVPFPFNQSGGTAAWNGADSFTFNFNPGSNQASFTYTLTDGSLNAGGQVTVVQDTSGSLNGTNGDDILIAKPGNTNITLNGNGGNDILIGNSGATTMIGGAGNDTFVFRAITDSQPGAGHFDTINDFTHGADHIDLTAIAGATNVQGAVASASTVAANSISWFVDTAQNQTIVYVNATNAANHVDMEIHLAGTNLNLATTDILHHT